MNNKELEYALDVQYSRYLHQSAITECKRILAGTQSREGLSIREWQKELKWHQEQLKALNSGSLAENA